jgi:hypothetical protein
MLCVVLVAKGKIANYYFGIVQTLTYAYIAYGYGLYGEVMLNALFYFPVQFIGIYMLKQNKTGFNNHEVFGTANYYVQQLFMHHQGDYLLNIESTGLQRSEKTANHPVTGKIKWVMVKLQHTTMI